MRSHVVALTALVLAVNARADVNVGRPFPALSSECTPAIPGLACPDDDPVGVGRVEMYSGEYFLEESDLRIPGRGFGFDFRRTYRSRGEYDAEAETWRIPFSEFGGGWDFTYNIWLESFADEIPEGCAMCGGSPIDGPPPFPCTVAASSVRVHLGNGRTQTFGRTVEATFIDANGNGSWDPAIDTCTNPAPGQPLVVGDFTADDMWYRLIEEPPDSRTAPTDLGGFTMEFSDGSRWHFKTHERVPANWYYECPPETTADSLPYQDSFRAVCDWIEDANGNRMHLLYTWPEPETPWGHGDVPILTAVIDTLGRRVDLVREVRLNVPGHPEYGSREVLAGLRDWTGRTVSYGYDEGIDHSYRVSSVTSPAVIDTPMLDDATTAMANDYPEGKTRTYSYILPPATSPRLFRLESIADEAGRELMRLEYSTGTQAFTYMNGGESCTCADVPLYCRNETTDFCRVTRHVVAGADTWFDYVRMPDLLVGPIPTGGCQERLMLRCTVTDPVGNVTVSDFNRHNLVARRRAYVGRANPSSPARASVGTAGAVDFTTNPPVNPLRGTDLASQPGLQVQNGHYFYETLHEYNENGLPRRNYPPNSTTDLSDPDSVPRVSYGYLPRTSPWSGGGWCDSDVTQMPFGLFGPTGLTRGMPRHVLRESGAPFEAGDAQCLDTHTRYEADDPGGNGIAVEGRAVVLHTAHAGEPELEFGHDGHGNLTSKDLITGFTTTRLEDYEYEDIVVADARVPGGMRTVRRLTAFTHPPHVVDGQPYRQRDEYRYYGNAECPDPLDATNEYCSMIGFLSWIVEDVGGEGRLTNLEYDALGRVIRKIDPAGNVYTTTWNALDQVMRQETNWRLVSGFDGTPMRADTHYDLHDRPVRTDVRRLGATGGTDQLDPRATIITRYDILGRPVALLVELETCSESFLRDLEQSDDWETLLAASSEREHVAFTRTIYGDDGQVARIEYPEATIGRQPGNAEAREYDERGMLFRVRSAPGKPEELVTQQDYDGNGNILRVTVGVGLTEPQVTKNVYDGFDRLRVTIDAMGNEHHRTYIRGTLVEREWVMGQVEDVDGNAGPRCLSATRTTYDDQNRPIASAVALFDDPPLTCDSFYDDYPTGWAVTSQELTLRGPVISSADALDNVTEYELDTLGRTKRTTGPTGDWTEVTYDVNGVPVVTESWQQADLGLPALGFSTSVATDSLGRIVESFDVAGHVTTTDYAEGQRVVRVTDALGFETRFEHDTAGRLLATRKDLWERGNFVREVVTQQDYDHDGRVVSQQDDAGNATLSTYDSRGRLTDTVMPDGSRYTSVLDAFGNVTTSIDPNGNEINQRYDRLNRRMRRDSVVESLSASPATEAEVFTFDGLGRMTSHGREDLAGRRVVLEHDSRGNVISEVASDDGVATFSAQHVFDERGSRLATCYSASGAQLRYDRDSLGRLRTIFLWDGWTEAQICGASNAAEIPVVTHEFTGPRMLRRTYGNGVVMDFGRDDDLHRMEDIVSRTLSGGGTEEIYRRTYLRDELHQRTFLGKTELNEVSLAETHDSLRRLIESDHQGGELVEYHLDGVGNREVVRTPSTTDWYAMTGREDLNQYVSAGDLSVAYDDNGNLVARVPVPGDPRPALRFYFDAYNRPGQAMLGASAPWDTVTVFGYDALNRRASKAVEGDVSASASYFHDGEALVEERDGVTGEVTLRVYGGWALDDLVLQVRDGQRTWVTTDVQSSVIKAFDDDADLVEQFSYDDYGQPTRATEIDGTFSAATSSSAGVSQLFAGAWYDWELGLYWMRTRYMDPDLGRFLSRDSAGIWADAAALGNGYTYAANNPGTFVDPLGLYSLEGDSFTSTPIDDDGFGPGRPHYCYVCAEFPDKNPHPAGGGLDGGGTGAHGESASTDDTSVITLRRVDSVDGLIVQEKEEGGIDWDAEHAAADAEFEAQQAAAVEEEKAHWRRLEDMGEPFSSVGFEEHPIAGSLAAIADAPLPVPMFGLATHMYDPREAGPSQIQGFLRGTGVIYGMALRPSRIDRSAFRTTREDFWRQEAKSNPSKYTVDDLDRMRQGKSPMGSDGFPMELHHEGGNPGATPEPMTRTDHRLGENYLKNHPYLND